MTQMLDTLVKETLEQPISSTTSLVDAKKIYMNLATSAYFLAHQYREQPNQAQEEQLRTSVDRLFELASLQSVRENMQLFRQGTVTESLQHEAILLTSKISTFFREYDLPTYLD